MSIPILILGDSGQGKSYSMRNLDPAQCAVIQAWPKDLPFTKPGWEPFSKETRSGNLFRTDNANDILTIIRGTKKPIIVLDDFQFVLSNEFMRRVKEKGFDKFNDIGGSAFDILRSAAQLDDNKRIYFMWHTDVEDDGRVVPKTIGKLLKEKQSIAGMFTTCLMTKYVDGEFKFVTKTNGFDPVKSPPGMFDDLEPNDLEQIDQKLCAFKGIRRA